MFPLDYGTSLDSAVQAIEHAWSCDLKLMVTWQNESALSAFFLLQAVEKRHFDYAFGKKEKAYGLCWNPFLEEKESW